ncbi:AT-rich interactive domain-containing protein 2 [Aricia agestis]|uniref:AT-rich interactive domain-containing protein 2 n=1 Tax=Aricia agestis TaxID=91739 RepID=UPI001C2074BD|nr:AT-rich interactive domain-containing protein 2 [Aricia agestis]
MAKFQINTKSKDYLRDKEAFLKDLKQFNESKNIPYKVPVVNGIEIDLYLLYSLVQQRGGLGKVNAMDTWESFLRQLRLPHPCVNGSTLLRKIYSMYLEKYERAKGPPGRDDDMDIDEDPRRTRGGGMPRISFGGGTYISASGEALRPVNRGGGPSERLTLSLLSPMPNEQDFAVNVCTVLAADHSNRLPLSTTPHILDFLLAHAGVYNHSSLRDTIGRSYYEARGRYPHEFWEMRAGGGGAKELADETKFMQPGIEQPELMVQALAAHNTLTDCLMNGGEDDEALEKIMDDMGGEVGLEDWVTEPSEEDQLFAPELPGGASCVYTQRVLQIASIVRSLSFHEENLQHLARNTTLIRFLLLCANCWVGSLRQSGLDTLGNVSAELIIKDPATCLISRHVLSTIQTALSSPDRARVLAALELLNKLAQNEANEDALLKALEAKVYNDVCALLTLRDIMVLVCTLECVYALTSLGDRASEAVAKVPGLVHTLVSLVTVEAQSYGPRACILMRVVETVSGPSVNVAPAAAPAPTHAAVHTPDPSHAVQHQTNQASKPEQSSTPSTPVSSLQQSHLQQRTVQENEHFAIAWLRSAYEPLPASENGASDAADVYRQYLACCAKMGRKGVIAPAHFPRLVRTVFGGTVGPNTVSTSSGETQQVYIGIRARAVQSRPSQPAGPSSPILKAQLTNKPTVVETKPAVIQSPQPVASHSGDSHNSSLIKHLLATKVSPAPAPQVAQRQQSQQRVPTPGTVLVQANPTGNMELDPEALIKCTTIIPGGVAATENKVIISTGEDSGIKDEPVQIQIDEQAQLTIKAAQNKMLADLLEKKSNPPVQVVQMGPQMNAPTIQITETGQIVQVKSESNPVLQINAESAQGPFFQIKNDQGQVIHVKNEQGQIIQLKTDQIQGVIQQAMQAQLAQGQITQGQIVQGQIAQGQITQGQMGCIIQNVKSEKEIVDTVVTDHSYTEPPSKKQKTEEKSDSGPQESVSKTAANLYAALAASALEDEDDLRPRTILLAGSMGSKLPPKQEPVDIIQPSVLVAGPSEGSMIIQEPILQVQQPSMQVQQPTLQVQAPTMQVQQSLAVQQPMLQVQPMDVQNIIASQAGQIILQEKPVSTQPTQFVQQIIATPGTAQGGLNYLAQNLQGNLMQKTIHIIVQNTGCGPLTLTVNNPGGLDEATLHSLIAEAVTQQQIIQNTGVIQSTQRVIVSQPTLVNTSQAIAVVKSTITQNTPQMAPSQQPIITPQPQPHKAQLAGQPQQIVVTQKQPPALIATGSNIVGNQIVGTNQQIIQGNQQLLQGNQQIIAVSNNQQIIVNTAMKPTVQRVVQAPRSQVNTVSISGPTTTTSDSKTKAQPVMRQVVTRQPVMVGNTKIGDKEIVSTQPVPEAKPPTPKPSSTPPPPPLPMGIDDNPWICHWRGCGKVLASPAEVFSHAARTHCPGLAGGEAPCQWLDCDRVPRKTFALLNHLSDKHCTAQALKSLYNLRKHAALEADGNKPVSVGYPPNAALAALNKHATETFNPRELMHRAEFSRTPEQMDENEGPVTKSIRLTAALILRNIVIYSNTGRRILRPYEAHLSSIALSTVEASRTVAQILYDMHNI